ncbi:efflux RND transporter periplasmic adaptor subunit [Vitiosangium sp. GDMCC 1.1324]|uniref:efflux RND transporter periplasmic adaptor subunit n=1 Tax=Vitiosangium sp. (strain GDMCC 1.1324) TaxID=2138576 RepID=UPI000D38A6A4|nr:HlyD family efflux transporter periplasmic adaptor subunit [Vitiosangium sp. GDMCC 1.1324]PTL77796.1 hypothetical protein DAT35_42075 [Vitiosangium sp. GDMCC 1.1324]
MNDNLRLLLASAALATSLACRGSAPNAAPPPPAATVSAHVPEATLATVTLTPEAESRLALKVQPVRKRSALHTHVAGGEVMVPSGNALIVTAPVAGLVDGAGTSRALRVGASVSRGDVLLRLVPLATVDRDLRAQALRAVESARARAEASAARLARSETLLKNGAGTERSVEEARADNAVAQAELQAAQTRLDMVGKAPLESDVSMPVRVPREGVLRQVWVAPGQSVAAGAPLFEVVGVRANWVRVPLFVDEAFSLKADAPVRVHALLSGKDPGVEALPVMGPPAADPVAATVDSFYELPASARFAPGQRVGVTVTSGEAKDVLSVPSSAVVYDALGGAWVYVQQREHVYARNRVDVLRAEGAEVLLERGPPEGASVVAAGAAELFGTEFGAGH